MGGLRRLRSLATFLASHSPASSQPQDFASPSDPSSGRAEAKVSQLTVSLVCWGFDRSVRITWSLLWPPVELFMSWEQMPPSLSTLPRLGAEPNCCGWVWPFSYLCPSFGTTIMLTAWRPKRLSKPPMVCGSRQGSRSSLAH